MKCSNCQTVNPEGAKFCMNCGSALERRCPALDYYNGFYMSATPDGLICADRDSIRARTGGECRIDSFRTLRAARAH